MQGMTCCAARALIGIAITQVLVLQQLSLKGDSLEETAAAAKGHQPLCNLLSAVQQAEAAAVRRVLHVHESRLFGSSSTSYPML